MKLRRSSQIVLPYLLVSCESMSVSEGKAGVVPQANACRQDWGAGIQRFWTAANGWCEVIQGHITVRSQFVKDEDKRDARDLHAICMPNSRFIRLSSRLWHHSNNFVGDQVHYRSAIALFVSPDFRRQASR